MSKEEPLVLRYEKLRKELGKKLDEMIEQSTERINKQLNEAIKRELDAMETALKDGDLGNAYYHEFKARILLGLP